MAVISRRDWWDVAAFRGIVGVFCAAIALSAAAAIGFAVLGGTPSWVLIGFEAIILLAGAICSFEAFRASRHGPAMTLLCAAGAVGVGSLLGFIGANRSLAGYDLHFALAVRLGSAALLAAASGCIVLSRDPSRSIPALIKGITAGAILIAMMGGLWVLRASILTAGAAARVGIVIVMGIALIGLVSACGHYLVRAFAIGAEPRFDEPGA